MLVYHKINPQHELTPSIYIWVERGTVRIQLLPKNTTQCPRPGLQPEPRNPGLSTLTTRTLGTDLKATFKTLEKGRWIRHALRNWAMSWKAKRLLTDVVLLPCQALPKSSNYSPRNSSQDPLLPRCIKTFYEFCLVWQKHDIWIAAVPKSCDPTGLVGPKSLIQTPYSCCALIPEFVSAR